MTKKQQALLQGIVVEDEKIPSALAGTKTKPEFMDQDISYTITDMHNVELTDQGFTATEKKASVTLSFEGIPCLLYTSNLKLWVKVKKDWRDSDSMMKNFGYNKDEI